MKKFNGRKIISAALALVMALALVIAPFRASSFEVDAAATANVSVNNQMVHFPDQRPIMVQNHVMVPVRGVFEHMGFYITWNHHYRVARLYRDDVIIILPADADAFAIISSTDAFNSRIVIPPVSQRMVNNRLMLPLRSVAEAASGNAYWDAPGRVAMISTTPPPTPETERQRNAVNRAREYMGILTLSRTGLIAMLEYEGFSNADAVHGADNINVNWYDQAVSGARNLINFMAFSRSEIINSLELVGFTALQANHGADNINANWYDQAVRSARDNIYLSAFTRNELISQLENEGFTGSQANHGANNINWYDQAIIRARDYLYRTAFSRNRIIRQLEHDGFSHAQAVHGVDNIYADWYRQAARLAQDSLNLVDVPLSRYELVRHLEIAGFTSSQAEHGANEVGL